VTDVGLGRVVAFLTVDQVIAFEKGLFASEICWTIGVSAIKFSVLAFYWRLFSQARNARRALYILFIVVSSWTIAVVRLNLPALLPNFAHSS